MPTTPTRRHGAAALLALTLALPACGGGTDAGAGSPGASTTAPVAPSTGAPVATPTPTVLAMDKTFWYGGFKVTIGQAEWLQRDATGASVRLELALENLRDEEANLNQHDIALTVAGKAYSAQNTDLDKIPAKGKNDGAVNFYVEGTFAVEDASLTVGTPDSNQAVVPLGSAAATTYEPKVAKPAGNLATKQLKNVLSPGVLDASYVRGEKDKYVVRIPVEYTYLGTAAGGYYLEAGKYVLTLANGNSVPSAPILPGDVVAEAAMPGQAVKKFLSFKVSDPGTGPFTLTFTDSAGATAKTTVTVA